MNEDKLFEKAAREYDRADQTDPGYCMIPVDCFACNMQFDEYSANVHAIGRVFAVCEDCVSEFIARDAAQSLFREFVVSKLRHRFGETK